MQRGRNKQNVRCPQRLLQVKSLQLKAGGPSAPTCGQAKIFKRRTLGSAFGERERLTHARTRVGRRPAGIVSDSQSEQNGRVRRETNESPKEKQTDEAAEERDNHRSKGQSQTGWMAFRCASTKSNETGGDENLGKILRFGGGRRFGPTQIRQCPRAQQDGVG